MRLPAALIGFALLATIGSAQTTDWPVIPPHGRAFVTVSIDGTYRYGVATYSQNGGENFSYRTVSGKNQLETFGVGPGELHITVTRMDGKGVIHSVDCAEARQEPNPNTVWRSRHYSSGNPNLTCHDKAEVVITVSSM